MASEKASEDLLGSLHLMVCKELLDGLKDPDLLLDDRVKLISQAIKFLKDNKIECDISANGGNDLMDQLLAAAQERDGLEQALAGPETYSYDATAH